MSIALSIIVPCHNVSGKFNIVAGLATIRSTRIEAIFVNDGSTDETADLIAQALVSLDIKGRVISGKFGGPGAARNAGIEESGGKYLWMVDADDVAIPAPIVGLVDSFDSENYDFYAFPFVKFNPRNPVERYLVTPDLSKNTLYDRLEDFWVCNILPKRDFLDRHSLRFMPDVFMYEDYYFILQILYHAKSHFQHTEIIYEYLYHESSLSHDCAKPRDLSKWVVALATLKFVGEHVADELPLFDEHFRKIGITLDWARYLEDGQYAELVRVMPYLIAIHRHNGLDHHLKAFLKTGSVKNRVMKRLVYELSAIRARYRKYGLDELKNYYNR